MSDLPNECRQVVFGEVVLNSTAVSQDPKTEGFERYIIGKHIPEDADCVETWGPVGDSDFGPRIRTIFQPGDVICTTRGPKLKVVRVDFKGLGAHTNFVLRTADPDVLIQPYLEVIVRSDGFQQHLVNNFRGSVNLFVNWSDAAKYEFALPPLGEQRRIAEVLLASQDVCNTYSISAERLLKVRRSAQSRLLFPPELSDSGTLSRIENIAEVNPRDPPLEESAPFFPMDALNGWERELSSYEPRGTRAGVRARAGDVLMARITPCLENGKTAQIPANIDRCGGSTEFIVFRPRKGVPKSYLYWLITSDRIRNVSIAMMSGSTGRQRVSGSDLKGLLIPKLDEVDMKRLAALIDSIEKYRKEVLRRATISKAIHTLLRNHIIGGQ